MAFPLYVPAFVDNVTAIPAAFLNGFRVNIGRAVDGDGGGSYTPSAVINVQGSGFGTVDVATLLEVQVGGQLVHPVGALIADADNQTFALATGQVREFVDVTGAYTHDMSNAGATAGSWIHFTVINGANTVDINRTGFGAWPANGIVRLPAAAWASATVYFDGTNWRLLRHANATAGTLA